MPRALWRVMRMTSEMVEGLDTLGNVRRAVTIFGSARTAPEDKYYKAARKTAKALAQAGYAIITGGGPGIMEAANRGARDVKGRSIGCNIELPFEQSANPYVDTIVNSVKKTNRLVIAEESHAFASVGAEISHQIMENAFDYLDAPVKRISTAETPIPYAKNLEAAALPDVDKIIAAVKEVCYL